MSCERVLNDGPRDDLETSNEPRTVLKSRAIAGGAARSKLAQPSERKAKMEAATGATTPAQKSAPKPGSKSRKGLRPAPRGLCRVAYALWRGPPLAHCGPAPT